MSKDKYQMSKQLGLVSDVMVELHVPDFGEVKRFYGDLGFEIVWERKPIDEDPRRGYLVMKRGASVLSFYGGNGDGYVHTYFNRFPGDTKKGYGVELIVPIDGVEEFYQSFVEKYKERVVKEIQYKWKHPDFRVEDPFGYYIRFVERYDWVNERDKEGNLLEGDK